MEISQPLTGTLDRSTPWLRLKRSQRRTLWFFVFVSPFLFGLVVLTLFPVLYGFYISTTDYDGTSLADVNFVGLENYSRALRDKEVQYSAKQTLLWVAINVPAWTILSFSVALLLNRNLRGIGFFRTLFYLPSVIPAVASIAIWRQVLDKNFGLLNGLISVFIPGTAIPFLGMYALQGLVVVSVWGGLGWGMVIFLAGLQDIPTELIESAKIDGANSWHIFRHITFPLMTPVLFFQVVMALIGSFRELTYPLLMGAVTYPPQIPRPITFFMVNTFTRIQNGFYGYGMALLWILFIAVVVVAGLLFLTERLWVYKGDAQESNA